MTKTLRQNKDIIWAEQALHMKMNDDQDIQMIWLHWEKDDWVAQRQPLRQTYHQKNNKIQEDKLRFRRKAKVWVRRKLYISAWNPSGHKRNYL